MSGQPSSVATALQQPSPAVLQQPRAHENSNASTPTVIMADDGYPKCILCCNKYVTEGHLQSRQHKRLLAAQEAKEEPAVAANEEDIFRSATNTNLTYT